MGKDSTACFGEEITNITMTKKKFPEEDSTSEN
jgi:hypothetical protein